MTVSSNFTDKVYQITGTTTVFAWGQDYDSHYGSLVVTEETAATGGTVVTTYVEGTDYTISNRNVVFNTAPSDTTHYIRITRDTYRGQPVEFHEGEDFPAEDFENALDRLAMVTQELTKGLADEKSERETADTTLQQNIDNETTARANGDLLLQGAINTESTRAQGVEGSLSNLTTTNKNNLVGAINEVDGDVGSINSTLASFGDVVTHDVDEFATAAQGNKADNALPNTTKYTANLVMSLDSSTYVLTIQLKDQNGDNIGTAGTVDLPLESLIVSGSYDTATKSLVILLDNGDTITIPVGDLVDGLQTEITDSNKLDADLIDDSTSTKKLVTALEKSAWNNKQNALTFDTTPTQNSLNPVTSGGLYNIIGDVVTLINAL